MSEALNVSGRWVGHYTQRDRPHPIEAMLRQDGLRLSGWMRDGETQFERSVFEAAAEAGLAPGDDEKIVAQLREAVPDSANATIRSVSQLPSDSLLAGGVKGQRVWWLKTYQGVEFGGFRVGEKYVGVQVTNPEVHYEGTVSGDGTAIEGRWWIDPRPEQGTRYTEGTFVLHRRSGAAAAEEADVAIQVGRLEQ
ncbi:MAG: hypothetical protein L0Z62_37230 [Gemmataceae bacterium]|nr:hypothetical protein [Gemmataceae bacterium]